MKTQEQINKTVGLRIIRTEEDGGFGEIWIAGKPWATVVWSWGGGWDHVSVSPIKRNVPSWDEMCRVKDMFWNEDEVVVQYHPRKSDYVNICKNCLHLWKPLESDMPTPPKIYV